MSSKPHHEFTDEELAEVVTHFRHLLAAEGIQIVTTEHLRKIGLLNETRQFSIITFDELRVQLRQSHEEKERLDIVLAARNAVSLLMSTDEIYRVEYRGTRKASRPAFLPRQRAKRGRTMIEDLD